MALMRWDPFAELNALHDQLNNLFSDSVGQPTGAFQLAPVTDIYNEDDKKITVEVHLPNFEEKDISVDVKDSALEIKAEHQEKEEDKQKRTYLVRESSSSFYRRIALPKQADEGNIKAHFNQGVLKVTVPLKTIPAGKKIAIEASSKKENTAKAKK